MPTPVRRVKRREVPTGGLLTPQRDDVPSTPTKRLWEDPESPLSNKRPATSVVQPLLSPSPAEDSLACRGKALFQRGSTVRDVVGRNAERIQLTEFLQSRMKSCSSGALYVSGLPGTGKSALVTELVNELVSESKSSEDSGLKVSSPRKALINCMTVEQPHQIFALIAKEYGYVDRRAAVGRDSAVELLATKFTNHTESHVLVLDELDNIITNDQDVLFKLFEWACGVGTNLILLGVANAIDLTDRFLPRLQAHQLRPQVIAFKPYSSQDIVEIIESRLRLLLPSNKSDDEYPLIHPAAVRICAAKTAANSGDLRMAFDVCRRAIELVEEEQQGSRASVAHVARVCSAAFGGIGTTTRVKDLTLQQKAVLCVLMLAERGPGSSKILSVYDVFQQYEIKAANNPAMNALLYAEYLQVITILEAAGLVVVSGMCKKKGLGTRGRSDVVANGSSTDGLRDEVGQRRLSSRAQLMDVVTALADIPPLRQMLVGGM